MAFMSTGSALCPGSPLYFCTTMPSHRRTRFIDFRFGQTPTTQVRMRGFCTGGGGAVRAGRVLHDRVADFAVDRGGRASSGCAVFELWLAREASLPFHD